MKLAKDPDKTQLIAGLTLVIIAFFCTLAIFYMIFNAKAKEARKMGELNEKVTQLTLMRDNLKDELETLKKAPPVPLSLQDLLKKSQRIYGSEEKERKDGLLWVDRQTSSYIITLGALNGLNPGTRLNVYQGKSKVGQVVVETPMDVISYVYPVEKSKDTLNEDYYRVAVEQ